MYACTYARMYASMYVYGSVWECMYLTNTELDALEVVVNRVILDAVALIDITSSATIGLCLLLESYRRTLLAL